MSEPVITVSILEDDASFRAAIVSIVSASPRFRVLNVCTTAEQARLAFAAQPPDVALIDVQLPGASGISLVTELSLRLADTAFVMLTSLDSDDVVLDALKAGAVGYLLKDFDQESLQADIVDAARGGSPMTWNIARRVVQAMQRGATTPKPAAEVQMLSPREREVLEELARGLPYKQIAERLGLSEHTIRVHIRGIYKKLHVHSRTEAVTRFLGH